jgi:glc operon protein GlcG
MKKALVLSLLTIGASASAQVASHSGLTLEGGRIAARAAVTEAERLHTTGAIAVVDEGGFLLAFERIDGSFPVSAEISIGKARTAAIFRKPTREFEEIVRSGRTPMLALSDRVGFTPLQGGLPIVVAGEVVGAIGVSGAASAQQDEELALAGATAVARARDSATTPNPSADPAHAPSRAAPPDFMLVSSGASSAATPSESAGTPDAKVLVNVNAEGLALEGHDPVAFFTEKRPVPGRRELESRFGGATYRFASAENKAAFDTDPARYEPAYGGYCGYAASINRISPVDVRFFQVLDGRLVLQHNQKALDLWSQDLPSNLAKADRNWPGLVERNGTGPARLVNANGEGVALDGYDVIAYHVEGRAQRGDPAIESTYGGARYRFASQEHRARFESQPSRWVPAYGGYCGYAASIDRVSPVDPEIFQIHEGRLILQHTKQAYELFNEDLAGSVARADRNWPGLVARYGSDSGPGVLSRVKRLLGLPI